MPMPLKSSLFAVLLSLLSAAVWAAEAELAVTPQVQKQRDLTRQQILESELTEEKAALAVAQSEQSKAIQGKQAPEKLKDLADKVKIHEQNIIAISKEISMAKNAPAQISKGQKPRSVVATKSDVRKPWLISASTKLETPDRSAPQVSAEQPETGKKLPNWIVMSAP